MIFSGDTERRVRTAKINISPQASHRDPLCSQQDYSSQEVESSQPDSLTTYKEFCSVYRCSIYFQAYTEKIIHSYLDESCSHVKTELPQFGNFGTFYIWSHTSDKAGGGEFIKILKENSMIQFPFELRNVMKYEIMFLWYQYQYCISTEPPASQSQVEIKQYFCQKSGHFQCGQTKNNVSLQPDWEAGGNNEEILQHPSLYFKRHKAMVDGGSEGERVVGDYIFLSGPVLELF